MSDVLRLVDRFDGLAEYPACRAYVERATARPAFKKAHADQIEHFEAADRTDEHRVWAQCSHMTVSVSLWVLTLATVAGLLAWFITLAIRFALAA
jgi:hypothetical protein